MNSLTQVPTYLTDRAAKDAKTNVQAYTCAASVYCKKTFQTRIVNALVKAPSTLSLQRLIRSTLGADYVLMTWNTTCDKF